MDFHSFLSRTGMSQSDLARHLGVSPSSVVKWRNGGNIDLKLVDSLLRLGMRVEELFSAEAWARIVEDRKGDFGGDPSRLSDEECRQIVLAGIEKMREKGVELLVLRQAKV